MIKQTLKDTATERRNFYQSKLVDNQVELLYAEEMISKSKDNTEEKVSALKLKEASEEAVKVAKGILRAFDKFIDSLK